MPRSLRAAVLLLAGLPTLAHAAVPLTRVGAVETKGDYTHVARGDLGVLTFQYPGLAPGAPPTPSLSPPDPPEEPPVRPDPNGPPPVVVPPPPPPVTEYEGFGRTTTGGAGHPVVRVTNTNPNGRGSLLEAVSGGNRTIVFDVAGTITPSDYLRILGSNVTIDGLSAPAPGITVRERGFICSGMRGCRGNLILRGVKIRDAAIDGIQIWTGEGTRAQAIDRVVIDRVSVYDSRDENLSVTGAGRVGKLVTRVTLVDSILAGGPGARALGHDFNSLIKYGVHGITVQRLLFHSGSQRNPQYRWEAWPVPVPAGVGLESINNVVFHTGGGHYFLQDPQNACPDCIRANIFGGWFLPVPGSSGRVTHSILIDPQTQVYVDPTTILPAPLLRPVTATAPIPGGSGATVLPTCEALARVLATAGAPYRDAVDLDLVSRVPPTGCP